MKRFGFLSAKAGKANSTQPARTQWRAHEDHPLSLTTPQRGETATSQRALVIGFAALAVAGAAYFGTIMLTHDGNEGASLFAKADAATTPPAAVAPAAKKPVAATAAAAAVPPAAPAVQPPVGKPPVKQAALPTNPLLPTPVKVTTITVPARPSKPAPPAVQAAVETPSEADQRWARLATEGGGPEPTAVVTDVNAYTQDARQIVSEGVEAVLRQVTTEKSTKKSLAVASVNKPNSPIVQEDSQPEMAGSAPVGSRQARIRSAVNLRSRPADGSKVIGVIPTNATVGLAPGCKHWCRVSFKGQTGFVYKSFLR